MVTSEATTLLANMYDYVRTKTAPLPSGAVEAIRAAHPSCRSMEVAIDTSLSNGNIAEATTQCRAYCTAWRQWAAAYPKAS